MVALDIPFTVVVVAVATGKGKLRVLIRGLQVRGRGFFKTRVRLRARVGGRVVAQFGRFPGKAPIV